MNRSGASVTAVAVLLALAVPLTHGASVTPATAQTDAPGDAPARVLLTGIDPVVGRGSLPAAPAIDATDPPPGGDAVPPSVTGAGWSVLIEHTGPLAWERIEVVAELHGALGSRSALRAALAGGSVPRAVQRITVPGPPGPTRPGDVVRMEGSVPLTGDALTRPDSAVHPLRLRVIADGRPVGGIDTAIVRLGAAPTAPLTTALVWPLASPPLRDRTGDPSGALDPLTVAGGRFDTLLSALAPLVDPRASDPRASDPRLRDLARGVALAVPAHLLEDLEQRASEVPATSIEDALRERPTAPIIDGTVDAGLRAALLLHRIRSTARELPSDPIASPYGDADVSRLLVSGPALQPIAARAVLEGERRIAGLLGRPSAPSVLLGAPIDPDTLDLVPNTSILVPYAAITAPDLALDVPFDDPVRTLRSPTGRLVTALVADPYLTVALGASSRAQPADPLLAAHEVLVRTAMVHLEAPGRQGRGLLLLPPDGFDPDPRFAAELLIRLARAPWLAPNAPGGVIAAAQRASEPARLAPAGSDPLPARLVTALTATARDLEILIGAADVPEDLPDDDPGIAVGGRSLAAAGDELMRATSTAFSGDLDAALALLDGVRAGVDSAFGVVSITLVDVTLTDRDGTVPMTLGHTGGVPLRVRVEVSAPAALSFTDGRVREVLLAVDTRRSIEVPVRSGATGRFALTVRVTDPSGRRQLAADTVGVRATAIAGPALALIILTVVLLTVYGTTRQRRRGVAWGADDATAQRSDGRADGREVTP